MHNERFEIIAHGLEKQEGITRRKMFGWDCLFVNGNSFLGGSDEGMLFKLSQEDLQRAVREPGVAQFDPMGSGKGMTGWVIAEMGSDGVWPRLAQQALNEALQLPPKVKKASQQAAVKKAAAKKAAPVKKTGSKRKK